MNSEGNAKPAPDLGGQSAEPANGEATAEEPSTSSRGARQLMQERFSLTEAIGGPRGFVESLTPSLVFLVTYLITRQALLSAGIAVAAALVLTAVRLWQRQPITQALGGVLGVIVGFVLVAITGQGRDFFLPGIWLNAGLAVALLVSMLIGWPAVGLLWQSLGGHDKSWRSERALRRRFQLATALWALIFSSRLLVQLVFYSASETELLGTAKLVMGVPLFLVGLAATWWMVRPQAVSKLRPASE